jgi:hypothetical protein
MSNLEMAKSHEKYNNVKGGGQKMISNWDDSNCI